MGTTSNTKAPRAAIFARVSSKGDRQNYDRQVNQLSAEAERRGWEIVEIITAKESASRKRAAEREGMQRAYQLIEAKSVDKILCMEVSRIGRRISDNAKFLEDCTEAGVSILSMDMGMETLIDGKPSMVATILFTVFTSLAKAETEKLSERIKSGQAEARKQGRFEGRPKGTTESDKQTLKKHSKVARELKAGTSIRKTAKIHDVSPATVQKVKKILIALDKID